MTCTNQTRMRFRPLQAHLLQRLATATSQEDWHAKTPVGLDLEHCMTDSPRRCELLRCSTTRLMFILQDSRTRVASENTCLALVVCTSQRPDRHLLLSGAVEVAEQELHPLC
jgi:hypothetical protein